MSSRTIDREHYDVFLSYSREDGEIVERLARRLQESGYEPWYDRTSIRPGDSWVTRIDEGLRWSDACLVLLGGGIRDGWAGEELTAALDLAVSPEKDPPLRVVPVVLPGAPERDGDVDRSGWPSSLRTRHWVDLRRGIEDDEAWEDLLDAVAEVPSGPPVEAACPYPGLEPFREEQAQNFFGRDSELADLSVRFRRSGFLAVTGASGSGKSSLVLAGFVSRLRAERPPEGAYRIVRTRPRDDAWAWLRSTLQSSGLGTAAELADLGRRPGALHDLAVNLAPTGVLVLVVDQLEELFVQSASVQRSFIEQLLALCVNHGPAKVVVTLRADFLGRAAEHTDLAAALSRGQYVLAPLRGPALRTAIEGPAHAAGLEFHAGLVDRIMRDVESEPASLPLLAHTLRRLWERRRRNRLTLPDYEQLGGVAQTLAHTADALIEAMPDEDRRLARRVLLRLTQPGDGTEDARVAARLGELVSEPGERPDVERVVGELAAARLVVVDSHPDGRDATVDVVHESLLRAWPTLRRWIDEYRTVLRVQRAVHLDSRAWVEHDRDESYLYRGSQLRHASDLLSDPEGLLNVDERDFVTRSLEREQQLAEEADEARRRAAQRDARYRLRGRIVGLAAVGLVLLSLVAVFADAQRRRADRNERAARAASLAAEATSRHDGERDLSLLLAVEALATEAGPGPLGAVLDGLGQSPLPEVLATDLPGDAMSVDVEAETGRLAVATRSGDVLLVDPRTIDAPRSLALHRPSGVVAVRWRPDGALVSAGTDGRLLVVDPSTGPRAALVDGGPPFSGLAVRDELVAAADEGGRVRVWRATASEPLADWDAGGPSLVTLGPDGRTVVVATGTTVSLGDLDEPSAQLQSFMATDDEITAIAVGESNALAVGDAAGKVQQWYLDDGVQRAPPLRTLSGSVRSLSYDSSGNDEMLLAGTDRPPRVLQWDASTGEQQGEPMRRAPTGEELDQLIEQGQGDAGGPIRAMFVMNDGRVVAGGGGTVVRWDTRPAPGLVADRWAQDGSVLHVAVGDGDPVVSTDPATPVASSADGTISIRGGRDGQIVVTPGGDASSAPRVDGDITAVGASPDGAAVVAGSTLGEVTVRTTKGWVTGRVDGRVTALAVTSQGVVAVAYDRDEGPDLGLWRVEDGALQDVGRLTPAHLAPIDALAFHPTASLLVSGSDDRTIGVWDTDDRQLITRLHGHVDRIWDLAFADQGRILFSGSDDETVRVWSVDGEDFVPLGHAIQLPRSQPPRALTGTVDGSVLVGYGTMVERWSASPDEWTATACRAAGRRLSDDEASDHLNGRRPRGCRSPT